MKERPVREWLFIAAITTTLLLYKRNQTRDSCCFHGKENNALRSSLPYFPITALSIMFYSLHDILSHRLHLSNTTIIRTAYLCTAIQISDRIRKIPCLINFIILEFWIKFLNMTKSRNASWLKTTSCWHLWPNLTTLKGALTSRTEAQSIQKHNKSLGLKHKLWSWSYFNRSFIIYVPFSSLPHLLT